MAVVLETHCGRTPCQGTRAGVWFLSDSQTLGMESLSGILCPPSAFPGGELRCRHMEGLPCVSSLRQAQATSSQSPWGHLTQNSAEPRNSGVPSISIHSQTTLRGRHHGQRPRPQDQAFPCRWPKIPCRGLQTRVHCVPSPVLELSSPGETWAEGQRGGLLATQVSAVFILQRYTVKVEGCRQTDLLSRTSQQMPQSPGLSFLLLAPRTVGRFKTSSLPVSPKPAAVTTVSPDCSITVSPAAVQPRRRAK